VILPPLVFPVLSVTITLALTNTLACYRICTLRDCTGSWNINHTQIFFSLFILSEHFSIFMEIRHFKKTQKDFDFRPFFQKKLFFICFNFTLNLDCSFCTWWGGGIGQLLHYCLWANPIDNFLSSSTHPLCKLDCFSTVVIFLSIVASVPKFAIISLFQLDCVLINQCWTGLKCVSLI